MSKKKPKRPKETILIICAHPDDEILGAGGTIAKYSQEGKRVIAVIVSYGEKSHWWLKKKYTIEMRVRESRAAGEVVGTHETVFLGLTDFELKDEFKERKNLALLEKVIQKYRPSKIFTHSPDDLIYADHRAVWDAVDKTTKRIKFKGDIYVFNIWAKDVRLSNNPKLFMDISGTFKFKWNALKKFKSQHMYIFQLYPALLWRAFKNGLEHKCRFAEVFTKVK
ncbi:PIG-L family deacetylase [Candidatus Woesearchaeota archaeon]|jgi:LmbE family N-acetylglucosaminyl deacetylase|nr:PIG-L family deacetylase [Candidatus Woesearchaeota archaeon]